MKNPKINTSFSGYSDADFLNKANLIDASLVDNAAFKAPIPTLTDVQEATTAYAIALIAAAGLGRNNVAEKNRTRAVLEQLLAQLGMYVMFIANGNIAVLISSGYTLAKEPQPHYIENPGNVILTNGITSGELVSAVKNVADSYLHEITGTLPAENTVCTICPSSKSQYVFKDLVPGKQYWVRVAAIGSRNQVAYSTVATKFMQ